MSCQKPKKKSQKKGCDDFFFFFKHKFLQLVKMQLSVSGHIGRNIAAYSMHHTASLSINDPQLKVDISV